MRARPTPFPPPTSFLISLKLNLWWNASTSWPPLSILLHPSFPVACPLPRISSPDSFRDTHMAEHLPGSRAPPPGQSGYCSLLMRFHAPVRHNDFREMLHAALTQLDGPIPKELGALYCEEASYRRLPKAGAMLTREKVRLG
ncbi:hypothetical protein D4764_10G0001780 [Takifugu flavidus]|uniref:Uncharacterized protein n=1 Tax=Takifugu flavidus TaxID=433684 RepID=A0A5C6PK79_9TELE|nr:hypothetical protein D4764_10G0001780 [Takifugu flavidus]